MVSNLVSQEDIADALALSMRRVRSMYSEVKIDGQKTVLLFFSLLVKTITGKHQVAVVRKIRHLGFLREASLQTEVK